MSADPRLRTRAFEHRAFLLLLAAVSIAFFWLLAPYFGAVLWGAVIAILSVPLYRRLLARRPARPTAAALATLLVVLVIGIIPLVFVAASLVQQGASIVRAIQSGEIDFGRYFQQTLAALPPALTGVLERFGLDDLAALRERLTAGVGEASRLVAGQALSVGQVTLDFVVKLAIALYLSFFLLRDGASIAARIREAIPLDPAHKRSLLAKFVTVVRATVKGNLVVAAAQGALGGVAFWVLGVQGALLWGTLMAFLSLIPAVGAALVWLPVALYFLATGALVKGIGLIAFGVVVIGLVDNLLRPILVGKDTRMPDYVVLVSTLGGLTLFGLNGFVIGPMIAAMFMAAWDIFVQERLAQPLSTVQQLDEAQRAEGGAGASSQVSCAPATQGAPQSTPAVPVSPAAERTARSLTGSEG